MGTGNAIRLLPLAVLLAALTGTFVATWQAARAADARAESLFREHAAEISAAVESKIELYRLALRAAASYFTVGGGQAPDVYTTFVAPLSVADEFRGLRAIGFIPRIAVHGLERFEAELSAHHGRPVKVWPPIGEGVTEVFPIALSEPMDEGKRETVGFNVASDPVRLAALRRAAETARAAASGPVEVVEISPIPRQGFLIVYPLYGLREPSLDRLDVGPVVWPPPDDAQTRQTNLLGYVVAVVLIDEMVESIRERRPRAPLPLLIHDSDEFVQQAQLYASPRAGDPKDATVTEEINVAGRRWTILFFDPRRAGGWPAWFGFGPHAVAEARLVPLIALLGIAFSIALFTVTRAQVRARSAAEAAAVEAQRQRAIAAESERRFRNLADSAPVFIWETGPDGGIEWVNLATLEFVGRPMDSLLGDGWLSFIHEEDREHAERSFRESMQARRTHLNEFRFRRADGEYRWIAVTGRPIFRPAHERIRSTGAGAVGAVDPEFSGYIGTAVDLTDQRRAMDQLHQQASELEAVNRHLERLNAELARSNSELTDFASLAAHDLKEPLRGISNYARFIREDYADQLSGKGLDMLETIERLGTRLARLLDALMEYARVGRGELNLENTDLNEVCRNVTEDLHVQVEQPDVEVICRPLPRMRCDPILVAQALSNLILNGLKYNSSIPRRVEVGALESPDGENGAILYVRDNGIGIASQHHGRVFRMFKRLHPRDAFGGGLGAGLAIVKKIVERHNGRIWIASEPDRGTTIYFTLSPEPTSVPAELNAAYAG